MKKALLALALVVLTLAWTHKVVLSHCEIPCGIYGDQMRIDLLYEDITTIEKSMQQIVALSKESPMNVNQVVRWVTNKDVHATKIQETVMQYFMTQRVKPADEKDAEAYRKYVKQLTTLHGMLVAAMKAKQTTDLANVEQLRKLVDDFAASYFTAEDLKHIRAEHSGKEG